MEKLIFNIDSWCSWIAQPSQPAICTKFDHTGLSQGSATAPDVSFLPAMQRRRLSPLARIVFQALHHCIDKNSSSPVIFSSQHGEINRTYSILEDIQQAQAVSPMAFSLSVHNAIAGQWSIATSNTAPMLALAPGKTGPIAALLEAIGMLHEKNYTKISVAFYEENLPAFYQPYCSSPPAPCCLALQLSLPKQNSAEQTFQLHKKSAHQQPSSLSIKQMSDWLAGNSPQIALHGTNSYWAWSRYYG